MFRKQYATVTDGDANWAAPQVPLRQHLTAGSPTHYIRKAPYFDGMTATPPSVQDIRAARALAVLGDSVSTDHISPAGSIKKNGPAGKYLTEHGVARPTSTATAPRAATTKSWSADLRQRPPAQQACSGNRRRSHPSAPGGTETPSTMLRSSTPSAAYPLHPRRQGVRLRLVRDWAAKGQSCSASASSSPKATSASTVQPRRHGHPPARVPARQSTASLGLTGEEIFTVGDHPGPDQQDLDSKLADGRIIPILAENDRGKNHRVLRHHPHRHPAGNPLLPARRHPPLRPRQLVRQIAATKPGAPCQAKPDMGFLFCRLPGN